MLTREQLAERCVCGHYHGDHGEDPPGCLTLPFCPCAWYHPAAPGGEQPGAGGGASAPGCDLCDGTGWIEVEDPILGDGIQARCPDCEDQ